MNEIVVNSALIAGEFESRHLNIGAAGKIEDIGRFSLAKLPGVARTMWAIFRTILSFRPHIVYLSLSPSGFAFYRDVIYVYIIKLFRPKLVFHLHGKGLRAGGEKNRLFRWLSRSIFRNAYVIFLSERLRSDAAGLGYKRAFLVNNGLPDDPAPSGAVTPGEHNDREKATGILYLSNYVRNKGVLDLVDALELVSRTHDRFLVNLVGKPVDIGMDFLQNYIREKGLAEKVRVCGPRYGGDKTGLLENADIFILPTYYDNEAFPLSILEAMKHSLPVISTYEGGIPDMIEEGVDGLLFPQRDTEALAKQIILLLDRPEQRKALGETARKKFLERFTVSIFERNMLQVFQQICSPASSDH
jgi:glycosyltransferase involved in cell wall biosynthesis